MKFAKPVSGPYHSYFQNKNCIWLEGMSELRLKDFRASSKSLVGKVQNWCWVCVFLMEKHRKFTSQTKLPMTWRCAKILALSHFGKLKVTGRNNSSPVHNFLMENPLKFLLHTDIAYDLIIWQNFNAMSLRQILSHWKKKWKKFPDPYLTYEEALKVHIHTKISYNLRLRHGSTPYHLGKFKVTCRTSAKFVSLSYISEEKTSEVLT